MPEGSLFMERRIHPRIQVQIPVKYHLMENRAEIEKVFVQRKEERNGHTLDISLGGMHILSKEPLGEGNILKFEIPLPGDDKILSAFAEVVWVNETGGGLRFLAMKNVDLDTLKAYLRKATAR